MRPAVLTALLTVITIAMLGISRCALPRGLGPTTELPPSFSEFTHQTSGYLYLFGPDERVKDRRPTAFVISDDYPRRFRAGAPELRWYEDLLAGRLGYRVVYRHKARVPLAIVTMERPFREFDGSFTTLHKITPEVIVLVKP